MQVKDRVALTEGVHVDEKRLAVLHHDVLHLGVAVDNAVLLGDLVEHLFQAAVELRIKILRRHIKIARELLLCRSQLAGRNGAPVHEPQKLRVHLYDRVRVFGLLDQQVVERFCVQHLEHRAEALADLDYVVGDSCRNAGNKSRPRHFLLVLYHRKAVRSFIDLDYRLLVDAVDGAVKAAAYYLAAVNAYPAALLRYLEKLGEARGLKYIVNVL